MNTSLISSFLFVSSFVYVAVCLNTVKITSRVRNSNNFWMQKEGRATTNDHLSNSFPTPSLARERIVADVKSAAIRSWGALLSVYIAGAASPAMAESLEDVNTKLAGYGLPPILFTPPGFTNLVSEFGRGNIREQMTNPLLVQFAHPSLWVVQKTSVNNNGEAGTISANDYIKGDSAFFFVWQTARSVDLIQAAEKKPIIRDFILKVKRGSDDAPYYIVDFGYELNTEAGFLIERRGVMSLTAVGKDQLQGLVTVSTGKRFRNGLEATLRPIAESFRVYRLNSGIFSTSKPSSS
eukprot:gene31959-41456_t